MVRTQKWMVGCEKWKPFIYLGKEHDCMALFVLWVNGHLHLPFYFNPFQPTSIYFNQFQLTSTHCSKKISFSSNFNPLELTSTNTFLNFFWKIYSLAKSFRKFFLKFFFAKKIIQKNIFGKFFPNNFFSQFFFEIFFKKCFFLKTIFKHFFTNFYFATFSQKKYFLNFLLEK